MALCALIPGLTLNQEVRVCVCVCVHVFEAAVKGM